MNPPQQPPQPPHVVYHPVAYPMQPAQTSGLAVTSMIMGIISLLGGTVLLLPPLFAVIFGHIAAGTCSKNPMIAGKGMAIAGLVMGWICLAGWIVLFLFFGGIAALGIMGAAASSVAQP